MSEVPRKWSYSKLGVIAAVGVGLFGVLLLKINWDDILKPNRDVKEREKFEKTVEQVQVDSRRGTEYFNSPSYDALVGQGEANAQRLRDSITEPNRTHLLSLLALREISSDLYEKMPRDLKARILTDALNQAVYFNSWGVPQLYAQTSDSLRPAPVQAIIDLGREALPYLEPLRAQQRSAPRWGSEEQLQDDTLHYRVADYAIALISAIQGEQFPGRAARDGLIETQLGQMAVIR